MGFPSPAGFPLDLNLPYPEALRKAGGRCLPQGRMAKRASPRQEIIERWGLGSRFRFTRSWGFSRRLSLVVTVEGSRFEVASGMWLT